MITYRTGEKPQVGDLIHCIDVDVSQMHVSRLDKFALVKFIHMSNISIIWCYRKIDQSRSVMYGMSIFNKCFDLVKRNGKEWLIWV